MNTFRPRHPTSRRRSHLRVCSLCPRVLVPSLNITAVLRWLGLVLVSAAPICVSAQENWPNMRLPTLGGKQFWTDHLVYGDYRIQQHAITGQFRLLDPDNRKIAGGDFERCRSEFRRRQLADEVPKLTPTVVLMLHGLGRSRSSMKKLAKAVHDATGWSVMTMEYASTRKSITDHAEALDSVLQNLPGEKIHLVAHSLGNIVIRRYLKLYTDPSTGTQGDRRLGRIVMLGPPNQGAAMARLFQKIKPFEWIAGRSGMELATDAQALGRELAVPQVPFAIIAGSAFARRGGNPLIPGPDDLIVGVEETKLPGAADFLVVPHTHTWLMDQEVVQKATVKFLKEGRLQ